VPATGPRQFLSCEERPCAERALGAFSHPPAESARPTGRDTAVLSKNLGRHLDNKLLLSLPREQCDRLASHLTTISLEQGTVLIEAGEEFDRVYFPQCGMLSLLAVLKDGKAIETATVGREGVVGATAGLCLYKSLVRVVVQLQSAHDNFSDAVQEGNRIKRSHSQSLR
jgi:Cyclic nucleotide-binding domain